MMVVLLFLDMSSSFELIFFLFIQLKGNCICSLFHIDLECLVTTVDPIDCCYILCHFSRPTATM